jgi:methylmalonyl-CoA epimerase
MSDNRITIDHIGIAVKSIDEAMRFYRDGLGIGEVRREEVPSQKVRTASFRVGGSALELLEATDPASTVAGFIEKKGPGIHHVALRVEKIEEALAHLQELGFRLIDEKPRIGAGGKKIAFIHPSAAGGVLIELCQQPNSDQ